MASARGCPDADEDGIRDSADECPYEKGYSAYAGCPTPKDKDKDGVPDTSDKCPDQHGESRFQGCPDNDRDGIPDYKDDCPYEKGNYANDGCPEISLPAPVAELKRNMVNIPAGRFLMGSNEGHDGEKPTHWVNVPAFRMGIYEVTQALWKAVMDNNPSHFKNCDNCPVENVSWNDVQEFLQKLNKMTGKHYRLPSEAEWEYAARGGQDFKYAGSNSIGDIAWYYGNSGSKTHPVGKKKKNGYGLYDMSGNVWEWCEDCWNDNYDKAPDDGKAWTTGDCSRRVLRGGSWYGYDSLCRVAYRLRYGTASSYHYVGFRVVQD
ncbi:MAG: formylglycine-generating enzyme family protein [bacterium]|nr:formylglycine-generating enzyme family protein [bacterium]